VPCDGCWPWIGATNQAGYGQIRTYPGAVSAHRLSYEIHKGRIPEGLIVCHTCDNPNCVNPAHLYAGTHKDNARDCIDRGRRAKSGTYAPHTRVGKLTDDQVRAIRLDDRPVWKVAGDHGVSEVTVYNVKAGRRKALVPD